MLECYKVKDGPYSKEYISVEYIFKLYKLHVIVYTFLLSVDFLNISFFLKKSLRNTSVLSNSQAVWIQIKLYIST